MRSVDQFPTWAQFARTFLVVSPNVSPYPLVVTDRVTGRRLDQTACGLHVFAKHVSRNCFDPDTEHTRAPQSMSSGLCVRLVV